MYIYCNELRKLFSLSWLKITFSSISSLVCIKPSSCLLSSFNTAFFKIWRNCYQHKYLIQNLVQNLFKTWPGWGQIFSSLTNRKLTRNVKSYGENKVWALTFKSFYLSKLWFWSFIWFQTKDAIFQWYADPLSICTWFLQFSSSSLTNWIFFQFEMDFSVCSNSL